MAIGGSVAARAGEIRLGRSQSYGVESGPFGVGDESAAAICRLVGGLVSEYMGSGPKAHTYLTGDAVTVVLEDTLTEGERRLVRDGMSEQVLSTRRAFQQTMREDLMAGVEAITGRTVRMCANQMEPGITVEVFVLADKREANAAAVAPSPL
jgi:uncharacterized protein YbcI